MTSLLPPDMLGALTSRNVAPRYVTAAALVLGCFTVGVFAVRNTTDGMMLVGALGCVVVYLTGPQRMAWVGMFLVLSSLPLGSPVGKVIGPVTIYAYQVALLLAILFLIPMARLRFTRYAVPLIFLLAVVFFTGIGLVWGNDPAPTLREASFLFEVIAGFVLALLIVRVGFVKESIRVMGVILWVSAGMILLSSLTGLRLAGRAESLEGETGAAAIRIITTTQAPALAVLTALIVAQIIGRARLSAWLVLGAPALAITLLSFSRHALIAVGVAAVAALVTRASWATVRRAAVVVAVGAVALAVVIPVAMFLLQGSPAGIWLADQLDAFSHRVFDGVSTSALAVDSSTLARLQEDANLWRAFGEAPLFGHGLGYAYQLPFGRPDSFTATLGTTYAHNFYMWWLVKAGIVGMIAFAVFALIPVVKAVRTGSAPATIAAAVSLGLLATCVVNPLPLEPASSLTLGLVLGAALAFSRRGAPEQSQDAEQQAFSSMPSTAHSVVHTNG
jgi:O-antigen ligase